jgi:hypothetical protein
MTILEERLPALDSLVLNQGSHPDFEHGACVMEAVSYIAGEPWSDAPAGVGVLARRADVRGRAMTRGLPHFLLLCASVAWLVPYPSLIWLSGLVWVGVWVATPVRGEGRS